MKFLYSKFFIYFIFILLFLSLFSITTNFSLFSIAKIRHLNEKSELEILCKKNDDIYNYYYNSQDYKIEDKNFGKKNKNTQLILDFFDDNFKMKYLFKYIKNNPKYIFFFVLLLIILLLFIYYSLASCLKSCLCCVNFNYNFFCFSFCKNKRFKKIICILIPFIYLLVFIFSLISVGFVLLSIEKFSGTVCVGMQFVDTIIEGDIRNVDPKWAGINTVSDVLLQLYEITSKNNQDIIDNIESNRNEYMKISNEFENYLDKFEQKYSELNFNVITPKMTENDQEINKTIYPEYIYNWDYIIDEIRNDVDDKVTIINNIFSVLDNYLYSFIGCDNVEGNKIECTEESDLSSILLYGSDIILNIQDPISNIKDQISTPVNNFYNDFEDKIIIIITIVIIFVILYCIIVEFLLSLFCCTKKFKFIAYILKWIFCFIYYTSIIVVIIGMIIGIIIGFFGCAVKDLSNVVEFITSSENLNAENPKIFGNAEYTKYLDVCLNGNGNLGEKLGLTENFEKIDNITDIMDSTEEIINETHIETSPVINNYINFFQNLDESYLSISYIDEDGEEFNIIDKINEINNYVSGKYSKECSINENWNTNKTKEGYIYDETYPDPDENNHYLIYLYDKDVYENARLETRYGDICKTDNHPYKNVGDASAKFGKLFKDIGDNILANNFKDDILTDLNELNRLYGKRNEILDKCLNSIYEEMEKIGNTFLNYVSENDNMFSFLNCKFIGNNKLIFMNILYTSLGVYLDYLGTFIILISLFIFIGIVFILIVIKNNKKDIKDIKDIKDLEDLDILNEKESSDENDSFNEENDKKDKSVELVNN